jgi:hypothetical protein
MARQGLAETHSPTHRITCESEAGVEPAVTKCSLQWHSRQNEKEKWCGITSGYEPDEGFEPLYDLHTKNVKKREK